MAHPTPDHDSRWHEAPPSEDELVQELVDHLNGNEPADLCGYCWDESEIRQLGIEAVNLHDDFLREQLREMGVSA